MSDSEEGYSDNEEVSVGVNYCEKRGNRKMEIVFRDVFISEILAFIEHY